MGTSGSGGKRIKSTQTAFDIIEAIAERDRPSVSEIAEEVGHSRSTVHYHLTTLQENRYVIRDEEGLRLGLRMAHLGKLTLQKHRLNGLVEKTVEDLADDTDAVGHVAVKEGDKLVWFYRSENPDIHDLPTSVGRQSELHCTAYGQTILAHLDKEAQADFVGGDDLEARTSNTLTDEGSLNERLQKVRKLGFAYAAEEFKDGIASVASPIFDESDAVIGAIGVTDTARRIDDPYKHTKARRFSDELPGKVKDAGRVVGDHLANQE